MPLPSQRTVRYHCTTEYLLTFSNVLVSRDKRSITGSNVCRWDRSKFYWSPVAGNLTAKITVPLPGREPQHLIKFKGSDFLRVASFR